ncbi:MAG: hypothetical protein HYZ90_01780 [Candidatus Omnitrophica bacterium]|nr:hypothetical protein [Candidatus Omnitrophota bacterium]
MPRGDYYQRLLEAYLLRRWSHLHFWHETPEENPRARVDRLGEYYLTYRQKADYPGPFDPEGIPLLNYRGRLGLKYNPIAIAQYGLAQFNRWQETGDPEARQRTLSVADWLVQHLERTPAGIELWTHHFEWPYREMLRPPWPSALAQGQGISVLVRAHLQTNDSRYLQAAQRALKAFELPIQEGGVVVKDPDGGLWLEEYLVTPPSHILNGGIGACWGLLDYWLAAGDSTARRLFDEAAATFASHLHRYDIGFWSLYELPPNGAAPMLASPFYHRLHIVQLKILTRMTGRSLFGQYASRWGGYERNGWCRARALVGKAIFKLRHY